MRTNWLLKNKNEKNNPRTGESRNRNPFQQKVHALHPRLRRRACGGRGARKRRGGSVRFATRWCASGRKAGASGVQIARRQHRYPARGFPRRRASRPPRPCAGQRRAGGARGRRGCPPLVWRRCGRGGRSYGPAATSAAGRAARFLRVLPWQPASPVLYRNRACVHHRWCGVGQSELKSRRAPTRGTWDVGEQRAFGVRWSDSVCLFVEQQCSASFRRPRSCTASTRYVPQFAATQGTCRAQQS